MGNEQPVDLEAKARFCAYLGHDNKFVVPIEVKPPMPREVQFWRVHIVCERCGERGWMGLTPAQWKQLQQDVAKGRVG